MLFMIVEAKVPVGKQKGKSGSKTAEEKEGEDFFLLKMFQFSIVSLFSAKEAPPATETVLMEVEV